MPQLIFKGTKRQDVLELSKVLPKMLSEVSATPIDYFTIEFSNNEFFSDGKVFDMYPLIEVILFDRGRQVEEKMAKIIKEQVMLRNYKECEVYMTHIEKENYYE